MNRFVKKALIRWILTVVLCALVSKEAGFWTALAITLICVGLEMVGWITSRTLDRLDRLEAQNIVSRLDRLEKEKSSGVS